jgi:hypothetical protein
MFSGHELVGQNHRALQDALQLRLMVMAFEENRKPLEERKQGSQGATPRQRTMKDWLIFAKHEKESPTATDEGYEGA